MIRRSKADEVPLRRMELPLALWLVVVPLASAATIPVDETTCTLVDAITAANSDTATGGCLAGSGADVLDLQADVSLSVVDNTAEGPSGLPVVTSEITVKGNNHAIARDGAAVSDFRLFLVTSAGDLTLENTTVSGGSTPSVPPNRGGAILNEGTAVTLTNTTLSGNTSHGDGGGLYNRGPSTATLTNSTLSGNSTQGYGGGIWNGGMLTITNSTLSGNSTLSSTYVQGGAIYNDNSGTVILANSTLSGNSTQGDGGAINNHGTVTLTNDTLSGNSASSGGGIYNNSTATLTNSTLSGNSASSGGANIFNYEYYPFFSGTVTLKDSIVSGGSCAGPITNQGTNFGCGSTAVTNLDPVLANNGGPTKTHALLTGSNAIDAAGTCGLATDQRGVARPAGSCDSGAFELAPLSCTAANGENHTLQDDTVLDTQIFEVCDTIDVGPNYQVTGLTGILTLRAGKKVILKDGASVGIDGTLTVEIDPALIP